MNCQLPTLDNLEGMHSVKLQEGENKNPILSSCQNTQSISDSDSEVDEILNDIPDNGLQEGNIRSDCTNQPNPPSFSPENPSDTLHHTTITSSSTQNEESSAEMFILKFAKLCAKHPGEMTWLTRIQRQLPAKMRSQFPLLLVFIAPYKIMFIT